MLVLHFVGLASLLGGVIVQVKAPDKGVNRAMFDGAMLQIITSVVMVALASSSAVDEQLNQSVVAIKFIVLLVITVLVVWGRRRKPPQVACWAAIGLLTLLNVVIAVFVGVTTS